MRPKPQIGDIWAWEGVEHYLILNRCNDSRVVFEVLRLEDGFKLNRMPIVITGTSPEKIA